jgi:hypothetical protein
MASQHERYAFSETIFFTKQGLSQKSSLIRRVRRRVLLTSAGSARGSIAGAHALLLQHESSTNHASLVGGCLFHSVANSCRSFKYIVMAHTNAGARSGAASTRVFHTYTTVGVHGCYVQCFAFAIGFGNFQCCATSSVHCQSAGSHVMGFDTTRTIGAHDTAWIKV